MRKKIVAGTMLAVTLFGGALAWGAETWLFEVKHKLHVGGEGGWDYVTLSEDGERLYAPRGNHTQIIETASGKVIDDLPGTSKGHGVALAPSADRGFITYGDGSVIVFNMKNNHVIGTVKTEPDCDGIFYDTATKKVILVSGDGNSLWAIPPEIDVKKGKPEGPLALGGAPESFALDGEGKAFVNLADKNQVAVVDLKEWKVVDKWGIGKAETPVGMAYDPEHKRLFSGCRSGQMVVMNAENGKVLAELPIGMGVDATVFDGRYAFASCGDGTLTVVGEKSPGNYEVVQTLKTEVGARTMTLNPKRHVLYLPTADADPKTVGLQANGKPVRPKFLADTFKILVVAPMK